MRRAPRRAYISSETSDQWPPAMCVTEPTGVCKCGTRQAHAAEMAGCNAALTRAWRTPSNLGALFDVSGRSPGLGHDHGIRLRRCACTEADGTGVCAAMSPSGPATLPPTWIASQQDGHSISFFIQAHMRAQNFCNSAIFNAESFS